jgi:hypothetical protein
MGNEVGSTIRLRHSVLGVQDDASVLQLNLTSSMEMMIRRSQGVLYRAYVMMESKYNDLGTLSAW